MMNLTKAPAERSDLSLRVEAMLIASMMAISAGHIAHSALDLAWGLSQQGIYGLVGALLTWRTLR
jgi:hypothetical protein